MKIRLLTIFALFLVVTNMGWAETSTSIYVNGSSGNDTNNPGTDASPVKTIAKAITLVSEGGTIYLATGEYTDDIDISKPLNLVGLGTNKPTQESTSSQDAYLTGKIKITKAGSTTIKNVKMVRAADDSNTAHSAGTAQAEIPVGGIELTISDCCFINNKPGTDNGGATSNCCIYAYPEATNCTLSINNSDFYLNDKYQRCFNDGSKGPVTFKMENSNIIGSEDSGKSDHNRPLAFYSPNATIDIINSVISVQHGYGITFAEDEMKCTIDNSEIKGYAGLYIFNNNHDIQIKNNSIISGRTLYSGTSDNFGAIVFEGSQGCNLSVTNSIITNEYGNDAKAYMWPILFNNVPDGKLYADKNKVILDHSRIRTTGQNTPYLIEYNSNTDNQVIMGNDNIFSYNWNGLVSKGNTEALNSDKECIYTLDKGSVVGNAASDIKSFLSNTKIADNDQVIFPEGTFELPQTFTLDKSLTIEGAGKDKTTIKGHIEVNPKQGETATLTAKGLTLEGNNNNFGHGIIGITGNGTGKVNLTDCKISGGTLKGQTAAVGVRMESAGAELTMKNTDIDVYYYGLGLREKNQKVTINGGSITGRAAIMTSAGNLGGYLDPTGTSITATGTTFIGKTIANGEGESYGTIVLQEKYNGVKGEFTNCTIETVPGIDNGKDAEKQMSALCVRSYGNTLNFSGSKLFATYAENNIASINSKIHASVIQLGWHDADFKGDDASTPSQNTIVLTNCELKAKEGEKYLVTTFRRDINQQYDALTINGTAYSVNAGNVLKLYQVDKNGKFVDDNGKVISQVKDLASLKSAIASASDGSTIHLSNDITGITESDLPIEIKKAITLEGNGYTLSGTYTSGGGTALKHLLDITSNDAVIRNLTVEKAFRSGINVTGVTGVILENIISRNNASVGLTVNGSIVTATNLTTSGNGWKAGVNVDKGQNVTSEPIFTFSNSSFGEAVAIYSDLADAPLSYVVAPANSGWTKHTNQGDNKKTIWKIDAFVPTIATIPEIKVNMLEAGQTLSSVLLVKGVAQYNNVAVAGTFSWNNPAEVIKAGNNNYKVLFTPSDLIKYAITECEVSIEAKQYYTVTTGVCQNGKVSITNGNINNRYAEGTELTLTNTPDAGYQLKAGSLAGKMTVTEDKVITAEFEAIQQTVTLRVDGGNGSISVNGKTDHSGSVTVQQGKEIVVQAIPSSGYVLESLSCTGGKVISKDAVTVDKDFTITAKFKALPPQEYSVQVTSPEHGKILLFDDKGNAIAAGSSVTANSTVSVLAVADEGYQLTANTLKNNSTEITNGSISVTANAVITAEFNIQQFKVESSIPSDEGSITLTNVGSGDFTSGNSANYGQAMTAKVNPANGYKLLSLLVNGKEIPDGGSFTVKAATTVKAVMRKLATITIDETAQTYVYDGTEKAFVVKTTPAGIGGFTVTYSGTPKDVGSYNVTISRDADDTYAAITEKKISGGLVITQAEMKGVAIPTATGGTIQTTSADGTYTWDGTLNSEPLYDAIFTPTNTNYAPITFSIPTGKGEAKKVTFDWGSLTTRSALRNTTEPAGSLQITTQGEGSIVILSGNSQLNSGDLYATQKICLRAIPGVNASANVTWTVSGGRLDKTVGNEVTLTLGTGDNIVTATFAPKGEPTSPNISGELTYNGSIQVPTITGGSDWQITFKQGGQIIQNPTDAGDYDVIASYPGDANHKAATDKNIGTFTIKPKKVTATVTAASSILQGQSLAQSVITGTADADGTFEWNTDTKNTPITTTGTLSTQPVKFKPTSPNYEELTGLSTSVEVTEVKGLTLRTLNLTVTNPDGGTVTMKLNDQEVASGATVTKDDKITIETSPNSNYTSTVSVTGATNAEGVYTVGDAGNVEVKVTFTQKSTPGGDDDGGDDEPEVVTITGVVLDSSSKTLAVGEEFKLTASVKPADADQSVTWSSSDETVATVKKGTVKALKAGKATITATASDDTHYAECEVTVSVATGIDELIASTRVLGCDGYIMIEPMAAIETLVTDMMGRIFYHGRLTEKMQIPVSEGVYLVRLADHDKAITVKVIVR